MCNQIIPAEENLNPAEGEVLNAFRVGEARVPVEGAEIRGGFLRGLFLDAYDEQANYRGTLIVGAIIGDVLNMEFCETKFPVRFRGCTFVGEVNIRQLKCPALELNACTLKRGLNASDAKVGGDVFLGLGFKAEYCVSLIGAKIGGQLSCRGGHFQNADGDALVAQGIKVAQDVFLNDGFTAKGRVTVAGADIGGRLDCGDGRFLGGMLLASAKIGEQFLCRGGHFHKDTKGVALNAQGIKVTQDVFLDKKFTAEGRVTLAGADIGGRFDCGGGSFEGGMFLAGAKIGGQFLCRGGHFHKDTKGVALNAQGIKVTQDVFLDKKFTAEGRVTLAGADIGGRFDCGGGSFEGGMFLAGAKIGGQFSCRGGHFHKDTKGVALNAQGIKVTQDVFLDKKFTAEGRVTLAGADIGGRFDCGGGSFEGGMFLAGAKIGGQFSCRGGHFHKDTKGVALNAQGIKVTQGVFFDVFTVEGEDPIRFTAEGRVTLAGAKIGGQFSCRGGHFHKDTKGVALNAQGIKVTQGVFFDVFTVEGEDPIRFTAEGRVTLAGAKIGGQFSCRGGHFHKDTKGVALNAQGIKVTQGVFFDVFTVEGEDPIRFTAEGRVTLAGAKIGGQFSCSGGHFQNAGGDSLFAQGIKVTGDVFLAKGFEAKGQVSFADAEIGRQLQCNGGFQAAGDDAALLARGIKVKSDVHLYDGFNADGKVSLAGADIRGNLEIKECQLTHLVLAGANVSGQFQDTFGVYKYDASSKCENPIGIDLDIDGFRYGRLDVGKGKESKESKCKQKQAKFRLDWAGSMSWVCPMGKGNKFVPQPYEQLMKVYREMGHINWARDVGFALEERRRKSFSKMRWRLWYGVLRLVIGYGYKPFRILGVFGTLILIGIMLFGAASFLCTNACQTECEEWHCMVPSKAKHYPQFNPVYYVVEVVIPVLPLGQTENWRPQTICGGVIQGLMTIIGVLALAIFAAYSVNILGPRGRDR